MMVGSRVQLAPNTTYYVKVFGYMDSDTGTSSGGSRGYSIRLNYWGVYK